MVQRARRRDRLALAAKRGTCCQMPREQAALAQLMDRVRMTARQRAALCLHVAETTTLAPDRERPRDRRKLPVQREHADRALQRQAEPGLASVLAPKGGTCATVSL